MPTISPDFTLHSLRAKLRLPQARFARSLLLAGFIAASFATAMAESEVQVFDSLEVGAGEVFTAEKTVSSTLPPGDLESLPPGPLDPPFFVITADTLTISPTATLNLQDWALIIRLTPHATLLSYLVTGYNGGLWDGYGISSSVAAVDPQRKTALGIINNAEAQYPTFLGRTLVPAAETLVRFTYYGDANLDGDVTEADAALFGTGTGWYHGDFDYDGAITAADVELFNEGFAYLYPGAQIPQVPEPGAVWLLAAGGVMLARGHRLERAR